MDGICKTSFNLKQHWCGATNAEGYRALAKHTFTEVRPDVAHQLHNSFFADDDGGGGANVDHIKYSRRRWCLKWWSRLWRWWWWRIESLSALPLPGLLFWKQDCGWNNNFYFIISFSSSLAQSIRSLSQLSYYPSFVWECYDFWIAHIQFVRQNSICLGKHHIASRDHTEYREQSATAWFIRQNWRYPYL